MEIIILVERTVKIPKNKLSACARAAREKWNLPKNAPVSLEDIVNAAEVLGIVTGLPDKYRVEDEDEYTDEDLKVM
jgi:hypothetical protein